MDARLLKLREVSQKDKYRMTSVVCGIQNMAQLNLSTKQRKTHRHRDQTCGCQEGGGKGRGMGWESGVGRCNLQHLEWINKVLLYSTGNHIQSPGINHNGKEY